MVEAYICPPKMGPMAIVVIGCNLAGTKVNSWAVFISLEFSTRRLSLVLVMFVRLQVKTALLLLG
ncbi:hypothetical protein GCM10007922_14520 [Shewanella decolorationis]|nr:hypothetical protein GCM10007922_14520 [Shewanella decolorationis]